MIDLTGAEILKLSIHSIGNKVNGDDLYLSKQEEQLEDERLKDLLCLYFLQPFAQPEYYHFTFSNGDFLLNPVCQFVKGIFEQPNQLHKKSQDIARLLFDIASHPQIKTGDLFVSLISGIGIGGELVDAVAIFKSENKQAFLKINDTGGYQNIGYEDGINIDKSDKGCLILNMDADTGYRVCVLDRSAKSEPMYWKESFLQIVPCNDNYHHTRQVMNIAKEFITGQLPEEYECSRAEQIDLLNRSVQYFKNNETFEQEGFEREIFKAPELIESYKKFDYVYRETNELEIEDSFGISGQAVKKQARIFKSVLKLDKNFHVYIHGDRELIEQGVDNQGRKYYKLYYDEEH